MGNYSALAVADFTPRRLALFIVVLIVVVALAALAGYFLGVRRRAPNLPSQSAALPAPTPVAAATPDTTGTIEQERVDHEKSRIIRSVAAETFALRDQLDNVGHAGAASQEFEAVIAAAHAETARYRQLVVDIENNAPPPILLGTAEPDDLKLIVGIGPVLERMLRNLGIGSFRQIARWTARDIAEFDAKLTEFPGRIVRDQWVTQARALHESKYGVSPLGRQG